MFPFSLPNELLPNGHCIGLVKKTLIQVVLQKLRQGVWETLVPKYPPLQGPTGGGNLKGFHLGHVGEGVFGEGLLLGAKANILVEDSTWRLIGGWLHVRLIVWVEFCFIFFLSFFPTRPVVIDGVIVIITTAIAAIITSTRRASAGSNRSSASFGLGSWRHRVRVLCLWRATPDATR
jgi:hypothetical protein